MSTQELKGEGNKSADRRYREGVADTVESTTAAERRKRALDMSEKEKAEAEKAAREGKSRARS